MGVVHQSMVPKEKERNIIIQSISSDGVGAVTASHKVAVAVMVWSCKHLCNAKQPQTTK